MRHVIYFQKHAQVPRRLTENGYAFLPNSFLSVDLLTTGV
jgi:hypothetical protein